MGRAARRAWGYPDDNGLKGKDTGNVMHVRYRIEQIAHLINCRWRAAALAAVLLVTVVQARPSAATEPNNQEFEQARSEFSKLWNVDLLMQRAADNIARRYNLNATQRAQTQEMLTREVTQFLNEHQEIWPLVRDMARMQQAGEQPSGKPAQRLAEKALPLIREIEATIVEANLRWRDILTEEQKQMHDFDLQDMAKTFAKMNDNFRSMASGGPGVAEIFPAANKDVPAPPKPPQPDANFAPPPPDAEQRELPQEHMWDRYVEEFIRDFNLDDSQSEAALSILRECKQRAQDYRNNKRDDFRQVEERLRDAKRADQSPDVRASKLKVWKQIERSLNKPILDMFLELQERLEPIPTDAQRAHARRLGREVRPVKTTREKPAAAGAETPAAPSTTPTAPAGEVKADAPKEGAPGHEKPKDAPADAPKKPESAATGDQAPPE